jgi:STE24 endopeptidase
MEQAWLDHDKKLFPYLWSHRVLSLTQKLISILLFLSFILTGRFSRLEDALMQYQWPAFVIWLFYFACLALVWEFVAFPFSLSHHWVERSFHLSKQSYWGWIKDKLKGYAVGIVLGMLVGGILFYSIQWGEKNWWWITCFLFIALSVVLAQLAPVLLIPIFFKLRPMQEGELKNKLLGLSAKMGVKVKDVYHLGMGEKTEKGNAAFVGMGKTKRILIGDTLYQKFPSEEVEAVFAHELGHQVHSDLVKGIFFSSAILVGVFAGANWLCEELLFLMFKTNEQHPFGVVLFFAACSVISIPTAFLQSCFSRSLEKKADRFAKEKLGSGALLASALERLTFQNRGLFKPNKLIEFFTYSHPAPWRRIGYLRS